MNVDFKNNPKTRDDLYIYNAHPCGCYDIEIGLCGLLATCCKEWVNFIFDRPYGKCWSINPHVCFKLEAHK